jgi:hypothetical protein
VVQIKDTESNEFGAVSMDGDVKEYGGGNPSKPQSEQKPVRGNAVNPAPKEERQKAHPVSKPVPIMPIKFLD